MKPEEFTFPIVDPCSVENLTVIPSLWRISSLVHSNTADLELENGTRGKIFRKSFSEFESRAINKEAGNSAEEEKMDMLWEDFNDELIHQSISSVESSDSDSESENKEETFEEECSTCDLKPSKTCGDSDTLPPKKKNSAVLVKVLKKLFLLQKMAQIKKRGPH